MIFKVGGINGLDLVPLAVTGGISFKRVNIKGGNGMTMADGTTFEDRIASHYEWSFKFRPMTAAEQASLLALLDVNYVLVMFTDPETNSTNLCNYYVSDVPAGYLIKRADGTEYWGGLSATFSSQPPSS